MAKKKITSLDSLMFFTGKNADVNAQHLEDREYGIFDEYIGELNINKDFDSVFSYTLSEVFVETTPKYNSIKDLTKIANSYILNKSKEKPAKDVDMYIDNAGVINFDYNFEEHLKGEVESSKTVPLSEMILFLSALNNGMYNKRKYYSKSVEVHDLMNQGAEYKWTPRGTEFNFYDEDENEDYVISYPYDNYITYIYHTVSVQDRKYDETTGTYTPVTDTKVDYDSNNDTYTYTEVPRMVNKIVPDFMQSYYELLTDELDNRCEEFKKGKDESLLSYYIYDLNSNFPVMAYTLSFGKDKIYINVNYDGEFNNWFHNRMSFNLSESGTVKITPAEDYYFNFAINENERIGEDQFILKNNESSFLLDENENISLLSPYKLKKIDFSEVADKLTGELDLLCDYYKKINYKDTVNTNWLKEKGSLLEELIIGKSGVECLLTSINGLEKFKNLKTLDLTGCTNLVSNPDLSGLQNIKDYILTGTNVSVFAPAKGSEINSAKLGESIESIILNDIKFKSTKSLEYIVSDKLTTLEINNVTNLDSYKLVKEWLNALKEADKLEGNKAGTVNYVNLNNVNWNIANYNVLLDLAKIELDKFTGVVNVVGDDFILYRKDYRNIINAFGIENVNNNNSDLNLIVNVGENAFKVNINIDEEFTNTRTEVNEYGETVYVDFTDVRHWKDLEIEIEDTPTGNSFIDNIVDDSDNFKDWKLDVFVNNNGYAVGLSYEMKNSLILPENTDNPEELHFGDILLYGKNTIVFVTEDSKNINQNFTKIGKFTKPDDFDYYLNYDFSGSTFLTFTSMEDAISSIDEDNSIEVEYGEPKVDENNVISVEYTNLDNK